MKKRRRKRVKVKPRIVPPSCTKVVIDELKLNESDAHRLIAALGPNQISADATAEHIRVVKGVWHNLNQPSFFETFDEEGSELVRKKRTKTRLKVFGHSISTIIRWMGSRGMKFEAAREAVNRLGGEEVKSTGIRTFLNEGKRGVGNIADLSKAQAKEVVDD